MVPFIIVESLDESLENSADLKEGDKYEVDCAWHNDEGELELSFIVEGLVYYFTVESPFGEQFRIVGNLDHVLEQI